MLKKFKTKELIWISLIACLAFVINIFTVTASTIVGNPAIGGMAIMFLVPLLSVLLYLPVKKFGTLLLSGLIFSVLAIPTPMVTQTPGLHKVPIVLVGFAVGEIIFTFIKREKYASIIAGTGMTVAVLLMMIIIFPMLGLPATERFLKIAFYLIAPTASLGAIGGYLGFVIYNKIKNKRIIKQISA